MNNGIIISIHTIVFMCTVSKFTIETVHINIIVWMLMMMPLFIIFIILTLLVGLSYQLNMLQTD